VSVATHEDGSSLVIGGDAVPAATIRRSSEVVGLSTPLESTWKINLKSLGYWAAWVIFGAVAFRCDHYYLLNGWWMVLLFFWFTANSVRPAHMVPGRLRLLSIGAATVGAAFLIYGTFEWLQEILEGWSWGPPGQWLRIVSIPLRAIAASITTAVVLIPQLRRHFGAYSPVLLMTASLPIGIADYGITLASATHWQAHLESSLIGIFLVIILPLILAAANDRIKPLRWPTGRLATGIARLWRGEVPTSFAIVIVYPVTIVGFLWLTSRIKDLSNHGYSDWEYATRKAIVQLLVVLLLVVGSMVTWRCFHRSVEKGIRSALWLQGIVALIAAPYLLVFVISDGFSVGNVITNSATAAFGSSYDFQVLGPGVELKLSGAVNYGLADRLEQELKDHPSISRLRLDSVGGDIAEAIHAARLIAAHNLDTVVSHECVSACTVMFVAGRHRTLENNGKLGFHAARSADPTEHLVGSLRTAYAPFGVERGFVARVEAFEPPALWYPTREELVAARVLSASAQAQSGSKIP